MLPTHFLADPADEEEKGMPQILNPRVNPLIVLMLVVFLFLLISCQTAEMHVGEGGRAVQLPSLPDTSEAFDSTTFDLQADSGRTYAEWKKKAILRRNHWQVKYKAAGTDSAGNLVLTEAGKDMERILLNGIFPYWYGTPWDFNGYTNVPGEGVVACGYFVSTTLKHIGFNVNRYKLAQQSSKNACYSLALDKTVHCFKPDSREGLLNDLETLGDGLYVVGLDYHVGYLLRRNGKFFFIHSSYLGADGVVMEEIENSLAFGSTSYYVSPVTMNQTLVKKWLLGEEIRIRQ